MSSPQIEWPAFVHTIARLAVDGHGHLYVFPEVFRDLGPDGLPAFGFLRFRRPDKVPVEVYSPEGERLFAGTMRNGNWSAAHGDFVYSLRKSEQTEEHELVRYCLVEPFE